MTSYVYVRIQKSRQLIYREYLFRFPDMYQLLKSIKIFQSYDYKCTAAFLWFTVYIVPSSLQNKTENKTTTP